LNRCDDLVELYNCASVQSDQLMAKIEEREKNRQYFQCIAHTINDIVDSVCSSTSSKFENIIESKLSLFEKLLHVCVLNYQEKLTHNQGYSMIK
jgi:hypothetical protein